MKKELEKQQKLEANKQKKAMEEAQKAELAKMRAQQE